MTFLHRKDITPMEEANAYMELSKKGIAPETIAARVAKSESHIVRILRLLKLIPEVKKSFDKNELPLGHALEICRLEPAEQMKSFEWAMENFDENSQPKSLGDLRQFITEEIHLDLREAAFDKKDATLCPLAGACTNCNKRTGFNKELFNDITKADICADPKCFNEKQMAHLERVKTKLKTEKKKFVEITSGFTKPKDHPNAITDRSFKTITGKPCSKAIVGLLIDGSKKGTEELICRDKTCSRHWGSDYRHDSAVEKTKEKVKSAATVEKERIEKVNKEMQHHAEELTKEWIVKALPDKLPTKLSPKDLPEIADAILDNGDAENFVETVLKYQFGYSNRIGKLKKKKAAELVQIIYAGLLGIQIDNDYNEQVLINKAAELGMDVKKLQKEALVEARKEFTEQLKPIKEQEETKKAEEHSENAGTINGIGVKEIHQTAKPNRKKRTVKKGKKVKK